ncbi:MAG: DUF5020 family protein [Saccharospirillaceae bacterium]|nr:hypothetical protein A3759_00925 [Thalassolituus sp. HI0120]MCH2041135.1 DUF5020 family protein [Saccharospirillaceae bacterium]
MKKQLLTAAMIAAASTGVSAEQYWADNSVSALYGSDYKLSGPNEDNKLTTMTLEHVSGHSWGGLFFFVDRHVGESGPSTAQFKETYGEFSPKFTLQSFEGGFVKNINAAFTYEFGSTSSGFSQDNYLYGIGADLNIPGMNFASATVYYANNETSEDDYQLTLTYGWSAGELNIDGYIDYSTGEADNQTSNFHFNPQITYNLGPALGIGNKVKLGIEYSYWNNKFGNGGDIDQNAISALLKVHL